MNVLLLSAGFMMGLLGSPHCLGMCGGIVSAFGISMQEVSDRKKMWLVATYHIGRLLSYMGLGVVAATLGVAVFAPLMHNGLARVVLGVAIMFAGLLMLGLPILKNIEKLGLGLWARLSPVRAKLFPLTTLPKALGAGLLWGLLPCGLVYGALGVAIGTGAAGTENIINGVAFMLAFGLGTMPMLVATQSVVAILQKFIKKFSLRKASGVLMLIFGLSAAVPALTHNHQNHDAHAGHNRNEQTHNPSGHASSQMTEHSHQQHDNTAEHGQHQEHVH